jgi:hypothetical protein
MDIQMKLFNVKQTRRKLQKLYPGMGNAWRQSMIRAGALVKREAKLRTPVDTGDLKRHSYNATIGKGWHAFAKIYYSMEYAAIVHETHKTKGKFLESAFRDNRQKIVQITEQYLAIAAKKATKGP